MSVYTTGYLISKFSNPYNVMQRKLNSRTSHLFSHITNIYFIIDAIGLAKIGMF